MKNELVQVFSDNFDGTFMTLREYNAARLNMSTADFQTHKSRPADIVGMFDAIRRFEKNFRKHPDIIGIIDNFSYEARIWFRETAVKEHGIDQLPRNLFYDYADQQWIGMDKGDIKWVIKLLLIESLHKLTLCFKRRAIESASRRLRVKRQSIETARD